MLPYRFIAHCHICNTDTDGEEWHKLRNELGLHPCPNCDFTYGWTWRTEDL